MLWFWFLRSAVTRIHSCTPWILGSLAPWPLFPLGAAPGLCRDKLHTYVARKGETYASRGVLTMVFMFMARFCTKVNARKGKLPTNVCSGKRFRCGIDGFSQDLPHLRLKSFRGTRCFDVKIAMAIGVLGSWVPGVLSPLLVSVENYCRLDLLPFCFCLLLKEGGTTITLHTHVCMQGPAINGQKLLFTSGGKTPASPSPPARVQVSC